MTPPALLRHHVCFLDVGHGNATAVIAGDEEIALIDVGGHSTLREFLDEQRITRIRTVYLSHADQDHVGALIGLLAATEISIDSVYLNSDASKTSKVWDDLTLRTRRRPQSRQSPVQPQSRGRP